MFTGKYGVAKHFYINISKAGSANHAVGADWTPAAGDVKISKDGGATANVTNLPTAIAMGNSAIWDFSLTATEMQAAQINITVADSATKAVDDTGFVIGTYGNASANLVIDFGINQTGDSFARIGAPAGASIAADIATKMATFTLPANFGSLAITVGGAVTAGTVSDKTGYSLNQAFPTNFASMAITVGGAVTFGNTSIATVTNLTNLPSIPANWITAAGINAGALNGKGDWLLSSGYTAPPSSGTIAAAVWDLATSGHTTSGTFGAAMVAAGGAGDPWSTLLPGSYGAGTAGFIIGNRIDATISSRLASAGYTAPLDAAGTRAALGLAAATLDTNLTYLKNFLDADETIDTGVTPWERVLKIRGTGTELIRQKLRKVDTSSVTSTDDVIGRATQS
jgi:hypothetical protein